jgi:hypothetical protein
MGKNEIIGKFAAHLDDLIKLRGVWEMLDGIAIEKGLEQGHDALERLNPELAHEFLELVAAYLQCDALGMVDEAANTLASIVKMIFFNQSIRNHG